jgi:hypothetical protein
VLPKDCPTAATSADRLATGRAAAPARSLLRKDLAAQEGAWWEPGQGAMRVAVSREGLPRPKATTRPWRVAQEEESEDTWGDVVTTNGGDASPPRPGEFGHSPRRLAGPSPPPAPLSIAGQGQCWERKRSSL